MSIKRTCFFAFFLFSSFKVLASPYQYESIQSFYLGEKKEIQVELSAPEEESGLEWQVDKSNLLDLDGGNLISVNAHVGLGALNLSVAIPYISPSFDHRSIVVFGLDPENQSVVSKVTVDLTVRAELVIRFKQREGSSDVKTSGQSDTDFLWDLPMDPETGDYQNITVNNHEKGLWVRFRYENHSEAKQLRSGGFLIHIYRGKGQYIVHQPFEKDSHLMRSNCGFEPISQAEWENPGLGLDSTGKEWAQCEFRGFVPKGMAYGFEFREHYLESEQNKKTVEIKNVGELNTELIETYLFLEASGIADPISAMCSSW